MIQLYPKGQTDFSRNGIVLTPAENEVSWQNGGRYDFTMNIPREMAEKITFDYGQILKVSTPPQIVGPISLGTVSYYTTNKSTKLYSQVPTIQRVSYKEWNYSIIGAQVNYSVGAKVTYNRQNYQCTAWDESSPWVMVPPGSVHPFWTQIPNTIGSEGKEVATLESGTSIMKVQDFNATYMEAATLTGKQGYIKIEDCDATGTSEERIVPQFEITEQLFTIKKIDKVTDAHNIQIEAEHYSYMLGRTMLGECSVAGVNPATALLFIQGAMNEDYPGNLYCGESEGTIDADWSWENAQKAILDPSSGLLKVSGMQAVRDNLDVYIVPAEAEDPAYEVAYGRNMKTVHWTGDVGTIVTRVYPLAQREDGTRMTLPEKYIDTELPVPYCRPMTLDTKLKIGQKIKNSDGTEVELTENEVYTRMRQAAQDLFDIDHADQAEVTLELDFVHMPDTEEYKQYLNMRNVAPMQWVRVTDGPMGISTVIQLTGYTWDAIRLQYKGTKYGDKKQKASIAGYDIKSGAVSGRALAAGAVGSEHIKAGAITAREIEAGSITADQIASKVITAELIAAGAIRANAIDTDDLTAIQATLQIASIADARIGVASIGYAQIKDANVQNLIARDALTDRYYIDKLQVRNVQAVNATVGELIVKAKDNKYYRLDIGTNGVLTPTEVTNLTNAEIAAGVTSDGHSSIIETDLTVQDLAASNMKAINALIDKLTAARINVDELFARTAFINKLNTTDIESTANLTIKTGGTFTVQSGNFEIDSSGNVTMTGKITTEAGGKIAGWDINAASMTGNKTGIAKTTNDSDIAFWAGNATAGSANFRVTQGGDVYLRSLQTLDEQGQATTVDLGNYPFWKLSYATVKSMSVSGNTLTITTTAGTITFSKAATTAHLVGSWSGKQYTVYADNDPDVISKSSGVVNLTNTGVSGKNASIRAYTTGEIVGDYTVDCTNVWNAGYDAARGYVTMPSAGTGTSFTVKTPNAARNGQDTSTFTITKDTASASGGYASVSYNSATVCRISLSDWWTGGANSVTLSAAGWQNGTNRVNASNGKYYDVSLPSFTTSQAENFTNHKKNVSFYTASVTGALITTAVDATSEYNSGWTGSYNAVTLSATGTKSLTYGESVTVYPKAKSSNSASAANITSISYKITAPADRYQTGYTAGYTQGHVDGVDSVTVYSVGQNGTITYSSGNYSVPVIATASNSNTGTDTISFSGSAAYNAGWNACLDACGFEGNSFYQGATSTYLYSGPMIPAGNGRYYNVAYGYTSVPARK